MANRRQIYKYKGDRCLYCERKVEEAIERYGTLHRMFQLNHVDPTKKDKRYDNLIRQELSSAQLDEVDKCVLLCNQCHGIVHAQNITVTVKLVLRIKNRKAVQTVKGQLVIDRKEKTGTLFTDEPILVWPYWVRVGGRKPRMVFGTELDPVVSRELRRLEKTKHLEVIGWDEKVLMRATWTGRDGIEMQHLIRYPFIKGELYGHDGKTVVLWARNGVLLAKDGEVIRRGVVTFHGCRVED